MTEHTYGIPGLILKGRYHSPNGGISERLWEVTIVGPEVEALELDRWVKLREVRPDAPAVAVRRRMGNYRFVEPLEPPKPDHTPYTGGSGAWVEMGGGSLYEKAWRRVFGHVQPVRLHDRSDTWELYNALCD